MSTKSTCSKWEEREWRRAVFLHELFARLAPRLNESPISVLHVEMRRAIKGRGIRLSLNTCYRLFASWRKAPDPKTVLRRWCPVRREQPQVSKIVEISVNERISLAAAHGIVRPAFSVTTLYRHLSCKRELAGLRRIRHARRQIDRREADLIARIAQTHR